MPGPGVTSDLTIPNPARIYDYLTGGRDNFAADRDFGDALAAEVPGLRGLARDGRGFMIRSVTWSASRGVGQFLDLGCGLPSSPNVHETARATRPDARVVYVDNDPVVLRHARLLLAGDGAAVVGGDVREPGAVLADPGLRVIDFTRPCAVLAGGVLSAMDAEEARNAVATFAAVLAPGSTLAVSCVSYADPGFGERISATFAEATGRTWISHPAETIQGWFDGAGLRVIRGQVANVRCWPMAGPQAGRQAVTLGGVGLTP